MIYLRNQGEFPIVMQIKGTLTTTSTNAQSYAISQIIPFAANLGSVWAVEASAGGSAAGTPGDCIDLQYCADATTGTATPLTMVSSGVMFNFASSTVSVAGYGLIPLTSTATATLGGYNTQNIIVSATQFNPPALARGGYLKIVVKTVGTTAGGDLTVVAVLNRARNGGGVEPTCFGSYNPDSDFI